MSWYPKGYKKPVTIDEVAEKLAKMPKHPVRDFYARYGASSDAWMKTFGDRPMQIKEFEITDEKV